MTTATADIFGLKLDEVRWWDLTEVPRDCTLPETLDPAAGWGRLLAHAQQDTTFDPYLPTGPMTLGEGRSWWKENALSAYTFDALRAAYTEDELVRLWYRRWVYDEVDRYFTSREQESVTRDWNAGGRHIKHPADPGAFLLWKVRNSMYHYSAGVAGTAHYGAFVAGYRGLRRFDFMPGDSRFEARLDHSRAFNPRGRGMYACYLAPRGSARANEDALWVDGPFGYHVFFEGEIVLTIGFAISPWGILLNQVQLRQKRGNRWVYKLQQGIVAHAVDRLRAAFDMPVALVTGVSALKEVVHWYGDTSLGAAGIGELYISGAAQRIIDLYDAPIPGYTRGDGCYGSRLEYRKLVPVS